MTTKRHITNGVVAFVVFSIAYLVGLVAWWQFFPYQTAQVDVPIEVHNTDDILAQDDLLHLIVVATKSTNLRAEISQGVLCSDGDFYGATPIQGGRRLPEGSFILNRYFKLDPIPAGNTCIFRFTLDYKVNPIRTITKVWESEPFEIKE